MAFKYRRQYTLTKQSVSDLTDYPVWFPLTSGNFDFSLLESDASDLRVFADSEQATAVDYKPLKWDQTNSLGTLFAKPASDLASCYLFFGDSTLSDGSSGANTFTHYEGFTNSLTKILANGTDTGQASAFDPVSRRVYVFGEDDASGNFENIVQWLNIDTGEVGFVYPGLDTKVVGAGVVYHPDDAVFYIYGGRTNSTTATTAVQSFDPATETFDTLGVTLPTAAAHIGVAYDPASGKVFGFGGFTGSGTSTDLIWVHDSDGGTLTDTTADLPVSARDVVAVHETETNLIYLIGGVNSESSTSNNRIDTYDPSSTSTDPVTSGVTLSETKDSVAAAHYSSGSASFIYIFGGYDTGSTTYRSTIEKLTVNAGTESVETIAATLGRADDDAHAFYDSTTGSVWSGPWVHSTGGENENMRKVVYRELDPSDDSIDTEATLGSVPTGWSSVGTGVTAYAKDPAAIGGNSMVIADMESTKFVRAEEAVSTLTGVFFFEFEVSVPLFAASNNNYQFQLRQNGGSNAINLRNVQSGTWKIGDSGVTNIDIAAIPDGSWHTLGCLVDRTNQQAWGQVNRGTKAGPAWLNTGQTLNQIWINSSTGGQEHFLVRHLLVRVGTTGTEPTVAAGTLEKLFIRRVQTRRRRRVA